MTVRECTDYIICHHSATARDSTTFESIRRYHIEERGWDNVGYHRVIEGDGEIHKGMPENMVGYHAKASDTNLKSLAVCLTGNFQEEHPSPAQLDSFTRTVEEWVKKYNIKRSNILGHREVVGAATSCPGDNLIAFVQGMRDEEDLMKIKELEKKIEVLELRVAELESDGKRKQKLIEDRDKEVKEMVGEVESWQRYATDYQKDLGTLRPKVDALEEKLGELVGENETLRSQNTEGIKEVTKLTREIERLKKKLGGEVSNTMWSKISAFWGGMPKEVKVALYLVLSYIGAALVSSLEQVQLDSKILMGIINLALVFLRQTEKRVVASRKKK